MNEWPCCARKRAAAADPPFLLPCDVHLPNHRRETHGACRRRTVGMRMLSNGSSFWHRMHIHCGCQDSMPHVPLRGSVSSVFSLGFRRSPSSPSTSSHIPFRAAPRDSRRTRGPLHRRATAKEALLTHSPSHSRSSVRRPSPPLHDSLRRSVPSLLLRLACPHQVPRAGEAAHHWRSSVGRGVGVELRRTPTRCWQHHSPRPNPPRHPSDGCSLLKRPSKQACKRQMPYV